MTATIPNREHVRRWTERRNKLALTAEILKQRDAKLYTKLAREAERLYAAKRQARLEATAS